MSNDSKVVVHDDGTLLFQGPDAVRLYHAVALKVGIRLLSAGIRPSHGWSKTKALAAASRYTGKSYKRTECAQAVEDLDLWIHAMRCAMPVEDGRGTL